MWSPNRFCSHWVDAEWHGAFRFARRRPPSAVAQWNRSMRKLLKPAAILLFSRVLLPGAATEQPPAPSTEAAAPVQSPAPAADAVAGDETNSRVAVQPTWFMIRDSDGNVRQQLTVESDVAAAGHVRVGLSFCQTFVYNVLAGSEWADRHDYRDFGVTGHWRPNQSLKLDAMLGLSQSDATVNADGDPVARATTPVGRVTAQITPFGDTLQLDIGFRRYQLGLSPQIVANRVVRNEFTIRPQVALPAGWRLRAL